MMGHFLLPSATRGALFEKTAPLDPPQKLLIKGGPGGQKGLYIRHYPCHEVKWAN